MRPSGFSTGLITTPRTSFRSYLGLKDILLAIPTSNLVSRRGKLALKRLKAQLS